ncbi:hypothetical protein GP486_005027 [Trichoglossum hirsutum]|uniref:Uncharacterized protein n=1 Tax=Trichoglossum hirsutum TaxID=265104 RepID=A0A9P8LA07_9PEZI|nr:hypothetical protein GP486_005027 [Trichoglossum hirsutum]
MDQRRGSPLPLAQATPLAADGRDGNGGWTGLPVPQHHSGGLGGRFDKDATCVADAQLENADPHNDGSERIAVTTEDRRDMPPPPVLPKQGQTALHTETFTLLERPPSVKATTSFKYVKPKALKLDLKGRNKDAQVDNLVLGQAPQFIRGDNNMVTTHANVSNSAISDISRGAADSQGGSQTRDYGPASRDLVTEGSHILTISSSFDSEATSSAQDVDTLGHQPPFGSGLRIKPKNNNHKGAGTQGNCELGPSQSPYEHLQDTQSRKLSKPIKHAKQLDENTAVLRRGHTESTSDSLQPFLDLQLDDAQQSELQPRLASASGRAGKDITVIQKPRALPPEVVVIPDDGDVVIISHENTMKSADQNMDMRNDGERGSANGTKVHSPSRGQSLIIRRSGLIKEDNATYYPPHFSSQSRGPSLQARREPQRRLASIGRQHSDSSDAARPMPRHRMMTAGGGTSSSSPRVRVIPTLKEQSSCRLKLPRRQLARDTLEPSGIPKEAQVSSMVMTDLLGFATGLAQRDEEEFEAKEAEIQLRQAKIDSLTNCVKQLRSEINSSHHKYEEQKAQLESATKDLKNYQIKYSGLQKLLEGLANDRNALKEDHQALTQRFEELVSDRNELEILRKQIEQSAVNLASRIRALGDLEIFSNEAKHEILQLQATVDSLRSELSEKSGLLAAERDRTLRLETDCSAIRQNHDELKKLLTSGQRSTMEFWQEYRAQLDEHIRLINELKENENLKPESLMRISNLITSFSDGISNRLSVAEQMHCDDAKAGKEREQLLRDEISALRAGVMSLEQQKLSLTESNAAMAEKLHHSEEKVLELSREIAVLQSESKTLNEMTSSLRVEVARLSALPRVDPQIPVKLQEMEKINEELRTTVEGERKKALTHKEDAQKAMGKLALVLEEAQCLKVKQTLENDRISLEKAAASVRQRELRQFENSIQQLTNAKNKAEEKAALSERQKQITGESFFALEDKVETLKKSEEIATKGASRMRAEMAVQEAKITNQQAQILRLEQLSQKLGSHVTEAEHRLAESEKQKDAINVEIIERRNAITKLEKGYETEVGDKQKMENTLRRYYLLSPDEQFSPDALERVISVLISRNTQPRVQNETLHEIIGSKRRGTERATNQNSFEDSSRSLSRDIEPGGSPPTTQTETTEPNIKTTNPVDTQERSDEQSLKEESLSMSGTRLAETPMASFCKINGIGKFDGNDGWDGRDGESDSELSNVPATPLLDDGLDKELQKSNISRTKQKSPKAASKSAAAIQNSKFGQAINNSSSPVVSKPPIRTYSAKRQRNEESSALKVHGKKRTKLNDSGLAIPDSQIPNFRRTPSQRRQSGKSNTPFLLGEKLRSF